MSKFLHISTTKGLHKRFDEQLYNKYDLPARIAIKQALGDDYVKDNPDKFGQDLIIMSKTARFQFLELQVCCKWTESKYPYDTVFVYARKAFYDDDTLFITLSKDLTEGYIFDAASFKKMKPRRVKKYSREFVYDVPWHNALHFYTELLDKDILESY